MSLAQRGSGKLVKPRDPAPSDRPHVPKLQPHPEPPDGLITTTFLFKRLQEEEEKIQWASLNFPGPITPLVGN